MTNLKKLLLLWLLAAVFAPLGCKQNAAQRDLQEGVAAFEQHRWSDAAAFFTLADQKRPNQIQVLMLRGLAYLNLNRYPEAWSDFDRVLNIQPENAEAKKGRGEANLGLGNYADAASILDELATDTASPADLAATALYHAAEARDAFACARFVISVIIS